MKWINFGLLSLLIVVTKVKTNDAVEWFRVLHQDLEPSPKCIYNPCRNGGSCTAYQDRFHCTCKKGWVGENCERHSNCLPNPCVHGDCSANVEGYTCTCKPGYKGKHCDTVQRCHPNPCKNGGSCTEAGYSIYCDCKAGFRGKLCEYEAKCSPINPCMNTGVCREIYDKYYCQCPTPYMGFNCEIVRPQPTPLPPTIALHVEGPQVIPSPDEQRASTLSRATLARFTGSDISHDNSLPFRTNFLEAESGIPNLSKSLLSPTKYDPPPFGGFPLYPNMIHRVFSPDDLPKFVQDEIKSEKYASLNTTLFEKEKSDKIETSSIKSKSKENDISNEKDKGSTFVKEKEESKNSTALPKHDDSFVASPQSNVDKARAMFPAFGKNEFSDARMVDSDATKRSGFTINRKTTTRSKQKTKKVMKNKVFKNATQNYILHQLNQQIQKNATSNERIHSLHSQHQSAVNTNKRSDENSRLWAKDFRVNELHSRKLSADVKGETRSGVTLLLSRGRVTNTDASRRRVIGPTNTSSLHDVGNQLKSNVTHDTRNMSWPNTTRSHDNDTLTNMLSKYSDKVRTLTHIINAYSDQMKKINFNQKMNININSTLPTNNTMTFKKHNRIFFLSPKVPFIPYQIPNGFRFLYYQPLPIPLIASKNSSFMNASLASKKNNFMKVPSRLPPYPYAYMKVASLVNTPYNIKNGGEVVMNFKNSMRSVQEKSGSECPTFCQTFCDPWCAKLGCCVVTRDQMEVIRHIESKHPPGIRTVPSRTVPGNECSKCHRDAYCNENRCVCHKGFFGDGYECKGENLKDSLCSKCDKNADCVGGDCFCIKGYFGNGNSCWPLPIPIK